MVPEKGYVVFLICWIAVGIGAGCWLLRREAPYGRFSNKDWGPTVGNRWGWFLMEATVLVAFASRIPLQHFDWKTPSGVMVALFFLHYLHRSLVYPLMIRTRGKRMPAVIMLSAMLFNTVNGTLLGNWFGRWAHYPEGWLRSPPFVAGVVLFFTGMAVNWRSDYILIHLRKPGETGYTIPRSWLFKYVSSPNLLGEIVEWGGYALLTGSLPALAFFIWTCANLIPRAVSNHRWYRQQFPDYPPDRRILFPFLW
ncbi:MAG: 3-oxo-5-alpha-steroid 4-dehydrogenase [Puia sp.]|nr:3-oxo-5-alpha-steroid 4-dehydrogenase [Puia sp.]